jgi:hypothetical protein
MGRLSAAQVERFHDEGYLVVRGLFDATATLDPVIAEYGQVLGRLADELVGKGQIQSPYDELDFNDRMIAIVRDSGHTYSQHFDCALPAGEITPATPFWAGPAVFSMLRNPDILDAIESLIGPEIYSNPVGHVRIKPPESIQPIDPSTGKAEVGATPWHQDNGVVTEDADATDMVTVWFGLSDATVENGCLTVVPRSHHEGLHEHCSGRILERHFHPEEAVAVPMERGSALFMSKRTVHNSLPNRSDHVRWSMDLRYHPVGQPTGRSAFPGFVARSQAHPETELHDAAAWNEMWQEARRALSAGEVPKYNRWDPNSPTCA